MPFSSEVLDVGGRACSAQDRKGIFLLAVKPAMATMHVRSGNDAKMYTMPSAPNKPTVLQQYGALPYRFSPAGTLQVLLITSRTTRRWIVPKGWPIKNLKPAMAAAREAYEEAGVRGKVARKAIGSFVYAKTLDADGSTVPCEVKLFPMLVSHQFKRWPEQNQREARWLDVDEAATLVADESLRALLQDFEKQHASPD